MKKTFCAMLIACAAIGWMTGCGGKDQPKEITQKRVVTKPETPPAPAGDKALALPEGHPAISAGDAKMPEMPPNHPGPAEKQFTWALPAGWEEKPPSPMRLVTFKVTASPDSECYISLLQGNGGGLEANVNRWRGQMGQSELTAEQIAALPKIDVLGVSAPLAEIPGNYGGMTGAAKPNYLLLAVAAEMPERAVFVKMIGPENDMRAQKDNFIALCKSLKEAP